MGCIHIPAADADAASSAILNHEILGCAVWCGCAVIGNLTVSFVERTAANRRPLWLAPVLRLPARRVHTPGRDVCGFCVVFPKDAPFSAIVFSRSALTFFADRPR